jgi:protein O-mannosyl-transferase
MGRMGQDGWGESIFCFFHTFLAGRGKRLSHSLTMGPAKTKMRRAPAATGGPSMAKARKKSACQQSPPTTAGAKGAEQRWRVAVICLALAAITFAVFGQTLHHEFVNHDDDIYVYENPVVAGGLTLKGFLWALTYGKIGHWHPLTWLSHMLDCQLYGLNPGGHHLSNVLLHTATVLLLFLVLRQMTGAVWRSAFVAAVFAIHPLRVESVAWIAERKDVLSGVFFMLTIGAYAAYARRPSRWRQAAVAVWFGLGLLCKNTLVTLPFVLLLLDWWPLQRVKLEEAGGGKRSAARLAALYGGLVKEKIPLFLLSAGSCVATLLVPEKVVGANRIPILERIGNGVVSYGIYVRQMVWPAGLAIPYINPPGGLPMWEVALALVVLAGISASVWACRKGRPYMVVGWLWYLGMLVPAIGFVQISYYAHADRYTYLPGIGLALAGTWAVGDWSAGWKHRRAALGGLMIAVIGALMVCAWIQTGYWQDGETLWNRTLAFDSNNGVAHNNLGRVLFLKGRVDESIAHCQKALEIDPDDVEAHNNLGLALLQKGRVDESIAEFQKSLQGKPDYAKAHFNLGNALMQRGRAEEAAAHYRQALQTRPDYTEAHNNLGVALRQQGLRGEAMAHFEKALELQPANPTIQNSLAWLLATSAEASLRNGPKAVELARQANTLTGGTNLTILDTLAAAYAEAGRFGDAKECLQKAIEMARTAGQQDLVDQLNGELKRYEAGLPLHQ